MYGFLQTSCCKLNACDSAAYRQAYCGQCAALHRIYGYTRRAMVSYDATFVGLLITAQQKDDVKQSKAWCGIFPKRMAIHDPNELPQLFSASMAAVISSLKFADSSQDGVSHLKLITGKLCSPTFRKAEETLKSLNFPVEIIAETSERQKQIEKSGRQRIKAYAEPTALFTATIFRFTAAAAGQPANEGILYEIGYHVGQMIYLIDSCIDIIDDMEKENFNALMAAYQNEETVLSHYSRDEVTSLAITALTRIQELTKTLTLERHHNLISNVLLVGLPQTIHQRISKSISSLQKSHEMLLKYLPHTALASALCLLSTQNAEANGWKWGDLSEERGYILYGFQITDAENCIPICDGLLNPSVCVTSTSNSGFIYCCQAPKVLFCGVFCGCGSIYGLFNNIITKIKTEKLKKQESIKKHYIEKNTLLSNKYIKELNSIEQYFTSIGATYRNNNNIRSLCNCASSKDDEVLNSNSQLIQQIDKIITEQREIKQLAESAYNKHITREGQINCRSMTSFDNKSVRNITTLLTACATKQTLFSAIAYEDFSQTATYQLWQRLEEYEFISSTAKNTWSQLNQYSLNTIKDRSFSDIIDVYNKLKSIMIMIETSHLALLKLRLSDVDVIHKDWSGYYLKQLQ